MMMSIISQAAFSTRLVQGHHIHNNFMVIYHYSLHGGPAVILFLDSVSPHLHVHPLTQSLLYIPPPSLIFKI